MGCVRVISRTRFSNYEGSPQRHTGVALAALKVGTASAGGEQEEAALERFD
jgi:hypothetical protein